MHYKIEIATSAAHDIQEAKNWYDAVHMKLAQKFQKNVIDTLAKVERYPLSCTIKRRPFRRVMINRFPYSLYYVLEEHQIIVVGFLHNSRDSKHLEELKYVR